MPNKAGHPAALRAEAQRLLQDRSLTVGAIAQRLGVPARTVVGWNLRCGARPPKPHPRTLKEWLPSRRGAMSRLLAVPEIDPGDVAEAAGYARDAADMLLAAFGAAPWREADGDVADPPHLRARLRAHIGRQIAVLDAALSAPERPGLDSAKVLRDLGGLKRLLDDLDSDGAGEGAVHDEPSRSDDSAGFGDPAALREEIARRFDRFVAGGEAP